jgi:hypothetical protein
VRKKLSGLPANGPKVGAVFIQKACGLCKATSHQAKYCLVLVWRLIGRHAKDLNQNLFGVLAKKLLLIQRGFVHLCNALGIIVKGGKDQVVDLKAKPPILALFLGAAIVISLFSTCLKRLRPTRNSATQTDVVSKRLLAEITQSLEKARLLLKELELVEDFMTGRVNEARAKGYNPASVARAPQRKGLTLIVGINYVGQRGQLKGCHNDASTMEQLLRKECYGFEEIRTLTDDQQAGRRKEPTARNIKRGFKWLLDGA